MRISVVQCRASIHACREIINRLLAGKLFPASLAKGGGTAKAVTEGLEKRGMVNCFFESPLLLRDIPPLQWGREERCLFFNAQIKIIYRRVSIYAYRLSENKVVSFGTARMNPCPTQNKFFAAAFHRLLSL